MTVRRFLLCAAVTAGVLLGSLVAVVFFVAVWWVVCAYFWPFAPCLLCAGRKTNRGSSRSRFGLCKLCGGSGSRQVTGSRMVHKAVRGAVNTRKNGK